MNKYIIIRNLDNVGSHAHKSRVTVGKIYKVEGSIDGDSVQIVCDMDCLWNLTRMSGGKIIFDFVSGNFTPEIGI